mmetsp:Transcript_12803/g.19389  ORF Transcript_12803/g.19389 Transcript_12803/m.19389 type:complete len:196 (-) Transcript_12803:811-1398(-)
MTMVRTTTATTTQGTTSLCALFNHGLRHSSVLITKLPLVRRLALIETLMYCKEEEEDDQTGGRRRSSDGILYTSNSNSGGSVHHHNVAGAVSNNDNSTSRNQDRGRDVDRKALEIILSNVQTSPYLSEEDFKNAVLEVLEFSSSSGFLSPEVSNSITEAILNRNWEGLLSIASSSFFLLILILKIYLILLIPARR